MSGLLDKANKVAEDKKEDPKQVEAVIEDRAPTGFAESDDNLPVDKRILVSLQVGGAIALLVSMFWLVQTGWLYATFVDYLVAITIMIFGWILYNASDFWERVVKFQDGLNGGCFRRFVHYHSNWYNVHECRWWCNNCCSKTRWG